LMMGADDSLYLLSSDAGYGFVARLGDLQSKNRAGKGVVSLPKGGQVLYPAAIQSLEGSQVAAVTSEGRLLVFPLADLPQMGRGKGNKIIGIPSARVQAREEYVVAIQVFTAQDTIVIYSGKRHQNFKMKDLEHYQGERGRRGNKLPRGFQKVDGMSVETLIKRGEPE
jgi:topoisomerase-4 subunit A